MRVISPQRQRTLQERVSQYINLSEGEQILHVTGRHWVVLLQRIGLPLFLGLICVGIAFYRAIGGRFLTTGTGQSGQLDIFNILLVIGLVLLVLFWFGSRRRKAKVARGTQVFLAMAAVVIGALFWFRYQGGQVFQIDRFDSAPVDGFNVLLYGIAIAFALLCVYIFIDWANDHLILTNLRVIVDDQVFLIRRNQEQVTIDDIQNVTAKTGTYPQHWFNFGTVQIQSATAGRRLVFSSAVAPIETQRQIDGVLKKLRSQQSSNQFKNMIEAKVYNTAPGKSLPPQRLHPRHPPIGLRWLLDENPEIDEKGTITWRPHWLFVFVSLAQPVGVLVLGLILTLIGVRLGILSGGWLAFVLIVLTSVFVGWAAWEMEDHRNDLYILTPTNIIDVEKKPFGPEDRRTASLGAVQNVNFKVNTLNQLLGYGDVILETAGSGGKFTFHRIPNASEAAATVNDYLAAFKRNEKERNLNDTLTLLNYYHKAQQEHKEIKVKDQ